MASSLIQIVAQSSTNALTPDARAQHIITRLPVLVLFPHNRCNCRCMMCDIWRIRETRELTAADLEPHLESLRNLGTKWVALSGGEALLHSHLRSLLEMLRAEGIRISLLSTGLLLADNAAMITELIDDIIVSLDGPREVHNRIRRVRDAYEQMACGIAALRSLRPDMPITARSTVQKANFRFMPQTVAASRELGLDSISFLAVDATSDAFNRDDGWDQSQQSRVMLTSEETDELSGIILQMELDLSQSFQRRFIQESPEKLRRIVRHFRVALGQAKPSAPRCNAPWVSAVIEADGAVRPCFFHPAIGNIGDGALTDVLNSETALRFRASLDIETNPTCQRCVCSLYYQGPLIHSEPGSHSTNLSS